MSVRRRDLIKHLEGNGFHVLRKGANHSIYTTARRPFRSNDTPRLTGLPPTNCVNRQGWSRGSNTAMSVLVS